MRAAAAIPAVGLIAGCALGFSGIELVQRVANVVLLAGGAMCWLAWRSASPWRLVAAAAFVFTAGGSLLAADAWQRAWRPTLRVAFEELAQAGRAQAALDGRVLPEDDEAFAYVSGVLRTDAAPTPSGATLSVAVARLSATEGQDGQPVRGGLMATVTGSFAGAHLEEWRAGRRVRMPVQLRRPGRYLNPGGPDGERLLARGGTALVGSVKSATLVEIEGRGSWWTEAAGGVRRSTRRTIDRFVGRWNPQSAAIVAAILIGDRAGLDDRVERTLQEAGTYHVIAISGGNIAILAGLLLGGFRLSGYLGRAAMVTAIGVLLAYGGLVEGGASVGRATSMAVICFGARALDHRSPPLNALWIVSAALLIVDPLAIGDPGFVLTFGATLGILLAPQPSTQSTESALAALSAMAAGLLRASMAAEAMLLPVGALLFERVTFAGLALNFLAIPLMAVAQIAGMLVVPMALISTDAAIAAGWAAHIGAAGLIASADLVRFAPLVTFRVAPPPSAVVAVYYAALLACWGLWLRRGERWASAHVAARMRNAALATMAAAALWILIEPSLLFAARGEGRLKVTFLDVGQGDSALLRFPRGDTMLVDAGGLGGSSSFDVGERVVAPALRRAGVRVLDYLVLSHGDPDHAGGAAAIVREFRPREVWEGIPVPRFEPLLLLQRDARASGARWANVYRGGLATVDGVEIHAVHPNRADWERQRVRNDDSLVLDVRWRDVSLLFTGDVGHDIERELAEIIQPAALRVLKVPHHGSLTSSSEAFLEAIGPAAAVFSSGRSNRFGHPAPAVLDRYRRSGVEIFRTDQDGAVTVDTDGSTLTIRTFTGRTRTMQPRNHEDTKATKK